ncbi:MAG TPA: hypothetical protein PKI37_01535 [Candidatus Cloacimonas sp.]|jgi:hypothetical protein|nr:hypothetical protein [Candidatus Cloacimonas sp.]
MNETLKEVKIRSRMMPGALTITGFLGNDERPLAEIIATDEQELKRLHRSVKEITDRMKYFSNASFDAYNNTVVIDDTYEVHTDTSKGTLTCPYGHGGLYRKYVTTLTNRKNNLTVRWNAMDIHLIEAHHFFEGKGSPYRLEPEILVKAIF